jgi:hypothetical protein
VKPADENRKDIERVLIEHVRSHGARVSPREAVSAAKSKGYREHTIRATMWSLIDRNELTMNKDWTLSASTNPAKR